MRQLTPYWDQCMAGVQCSYRSVHRHPDTAELIRSTYVNLTPELDPQGAVIGLCSMLTDVTAQLMQEEAINQLNASLEARVEQRTNELVTSLETLKQTQANLIESEKLASLGAMVAGVAHELNTPLGNAKMMFSTLADHQRDFERAMETGIRRSDLRSFLDTVREVVDVVERNLQRTVELVESFKQVAVDQSSEQRRSFVLDGVISEVTLSLMPSLRRSRITFENATPAGIQMDSFPGPLGQVFINLINNALKHAFEGRTSGQMRLLVEPMNDEWVRISFVDDGNGIPPDHLARVFDPFFTTKMGRGGTGLGLNIVRNIVTGLLGGRIEVHSTVGTGTSFTIELPRTAPQSSARPTLSLQ